MQVPDAKSAFPNRSHLTHRVFKLARLSRDRTAPRRATHSMRGGIDKRKGLNQSAGRIDDFEAPSLPVLRIGRVGCAQFLDGFHGGRKGGLGVGDLRAFFVANGIVAVCQMKIISHSQNQRGWTCRLKTSGCHLSTKCLNCNA